MFLLGVVALTAFATPASGDTADATAALTTRLKVASADIERKTADPSATIDSRDLGNAALTTLLNGGDATVARRELDRAFAKQDLATNSPTFGQMQWRTGDAGITDLNAAPFFGQAMAPILLGYAKRLQPNYLASLRPRLVALTTAISRRAVPVTYTNMFLTRAVDLLLLGQYLADDAAVSQGRAALNDWIANTKSTGINEFDSTWYYPVDLTALSQCYRYAADAGDRSTCEQALRYIWTDVAANYMPASHKLAGPSSREYDFVSGNGDMAYWFEAIGWDSPAQISKANLLSAHIADLLQNGGYRPPDSLRTLAFSGPRDVTSTYDAYPGHTRWNWVGKNVSLGCAGGSYGGQDKLLVATFAGSAKQAQLNVLVQKSGAPYGVQTSTVKPEHISPALGCLEHGGAAIATLEVESTGLRATPHGLETDVMFPKDATLAVNGTTVSLANGDVAFKLGDILAVRAGGGVVALKALRVDNIAEAPMLKLTTDAKGSARGAAWLSVSHLRPGETAAPGSVMRETFIIVARDDGSIAAATSEIKDAAAQDMLGAVDWRVRATFPQGRFELVRSSTKRGSVGLGTIDGNPAKRLTLGVNDRDLSAGIW